MKKPYEVVGNGNRLVAVIEDTAGFAGVCGQVRLMPSELSALVSEIDRALEAFVLVVLNAAPG